MHNIRMYDTGRASKYSRRNDGWAFGSVFGGILVIIIGIIMVFIGTLDPEIPMTVAYLGGALMIPPVVNLIMFATHRNFMLGADATKAMDAVYSLPKEVRAKYKITRAEAEVLDGAEVNQLVATVREYRNNSETAAGKNLDILRLGAELNDYNETVKKIEQMS